MNETTESYPWRDAELMHELYHEQGLTHAQIATRLSCTQPTITNWMEKHGIESRDQRSDDNTHTTLWVSKETATRLEDLKPFETISWDEFLTELADRYEATEEIL